MELVFPIEEERIRRRVEEVISLLLEDTVNAREQQPDGSYKMVDGRGRPQLNAQWELQSRAQEAYRIKMEKDMETEGMDRL